MNLNNLATRQAFMSEVEKNKTLLTPGCVISGYGDKYKITEVNEDYIVCISLETEEEDYFEFESMQLHWTICITDSVSENIEQMMFRLPEGGWIDYAERKEQLDCLYNKN